MVVTEQWTGTNIVFAVPHTLLKAVWIELLWEVAGIVRRHRKDGKLSVPSQSCDACLKPMRNSLLQRACVPLYVIMGGRHQEPCECGLFLSVFAETVLLQGNIWTELLDPWMLGCKFLDRLGENRVERIDEDVEKSLVYMCLTNAKDDDPGCRRCILLFMISSDMDSDIELLGSADNFRTERVPSVNFRVQKPEKKAASSPPDVQLTLTLAEILAFLFLSVYDVEHRESCPVVCAKLGCFSGFDPECYLQGQAYVTPEKPPLLTPPTLQSQGSACLIGTTLAQGIGERVLLSVQIQGESGPAIAHDTILAPWTIWIEKQNQPSPEQLMRSPEEPERALCGVIQRPSLGSLPGDHFPEPAPPSSHGKLLMKRFLLVPLPVYPQNTLDEPHSPAAVYLIMS
ncbi:hypothetical protein E5288_WYG006571 [Bos mutus]|uniref:Uncharacterized protein n=1 Tax=Bos mutus TaxID=72004 RepID=A0A6B0RBT8_9CETA|nr:hypothetical protein [Bos mutus]